jgi:NAD(P)-dependent dehydrogenase (short-subunit alcohol dehydrogenase family)
VEALIARGAVCHLPVRKGGGLRLGELAAAALAREQVRVTAGIDLADEAAVTGWYAGLPPLGASIHCAGGFDASPVLETTAAALDRMLSLNLRTAFLCSREAIRNMRRAAAGGRIVNVVSRVAFEPAAGAGKAAYTASKAALAAFTQALAEEVAAEGILVNAVAPFTLDTAANRGGAPPGGRDRGWAALPDVAETILFLASGENRVVRGALVPVPGRERREP